MSVGEDVVTSCIDHPAGCRSAHFAVTTPDHRGKGKRLAVNRLPKRLFPYLGKMQAPGNEDAVFRVIDQSEPGGFS